MANLHGRARELSALDGELGRTVTGSPGLVLLSGEPGIGKTALLGHLADRVRGLGGVVGWGTCWDGAGTPAFWPWHRALPRFTDLLAGVPPDGPGHFTLLTAVADLLAEVDRPHLLVLDDLQWADADCLRLLRFLARDLRECPVLLAGAFRDLDLPAEHPTRLLAADGTAARLHMPLGGIPAAAIAEVISEVTGEAPAAEVVERVEARTAGNPFFVREVARLPETELTRRLSGPVRDAVGARVDTLPEPVRAALCMAAVIGRDFEDALVARAQAMNLDDLDRVLAPAVSTRLVESSGPRRHRFVHDLVREHLLASLSPPELRLRHHLVHDALAVTPDVPMRTSRLAGHAIKAVPDLDAQTALARCDAAATEADGLQMYDEAARHLRAATELAGGAVPERLLRLADQLRRAGHLGDAGAQYTALLDAGGDVTIRARTALGLHEVGVQSSDTRQPLIRTLEDSLVDLRRAGSQGGPRAEPDGGLVAELTAALARELADGPQRDEVRAAELTAEAVRLARHHGDPTVLAACLFARHDVIWAPDTAAERVELGAEMCRVAEIAAPALAFQGALCRYVALLELGQPDAETALTEVEERAARLGQPVLKYLARTRRDAWDAMTGPATIAEEIEHRIEESYAFGTRLEVPDAYGVYVTQGVCLDLCADDAPAAMQARRRRIGARLMPPDFAIEERAFELLAAGDPAGAAILAAQAPSPTDRAMFRWRELAAVAFLTELAWRTSSAAVAEQAYRHLQKYAGQLVVIGGGVAIVGPVDLFLGMSAMTCGRSDAGRRHLESALRQSRALGARPWVDRITGMLAPPVSPSVFRRDGAVWRLEFADRLVHAPHSKGMGDLATLLAQPGQPVSALRLAGGAEAAPQVGSDPVLDDAARSSYRRRLEQLDEEIDEATLARDEPALRSAQDERDALIAELSRSVGLGGRSRRLGDPGERARSTVTARIRETLTRIEAQHPELGAHLRASVRTGRECVYLPEPEVHWQV